MTPSQLTTLKAFILADPVLSQKPMGPDGDFDIAQALNALASPAFPVWNEQALVRDVFNAIDFSKFTPAAALDDASLADALVCSRRQTQMLAIQTKQMNLQNMLIGKETVDATKLSIRSGLRDAVIALPAGAAGAAISAGGASGVNMMNALVRNGTVVEKALTLGTQALGNVSADQMGFIGPISPDDVHTARIS